MIETMVKVSMRAENALNCSYAILIRDTAKIIIILKDLECAIFNWHDLQTCEAWQMQPGAFGGSCIRPYLLLKHYASASHAYTDFLKLIGKMCKKNKDSKYFANRQMEDNRMVFVDAHSEHMISEEESASFEARYSEFMRFVMENKHRF